MKLVRNLAAVCAVLLGLQTFASSFSIGSACGTVTKSGTLTTSDKQTSIATTIYIDYYSFTANSSGAVTTSFTTSVTKGKGAVTLNVVSRDDEKFPDSWNASTHSFTVRKGYNYTVKIYTYYCNNQTYSFTLNLPKCQTVAKSTVSFAAGGGSGTMNSVSVTTGSSYTLPSCSFTRSGYTFAGWNITSCCTAWDNPYLAGRTVTVEENLTLTATWNPNSSPSYPDLKPYTKSGWDSYLVVNTSSSSKSNASSFKETDSIYVHFSAICADNDTSSAFVSKIYVDNVCKFTVTSGQTNKGVNFFTPNGCSMGNLSSGTHKIKVVLDDGNKVKESNESNNTFSKSIYVAPVTKYYKIRFNKNDDSGDTKTVSGYPIGKYKSLPWLTSGLGWTYQNITFKGWSKSSTACSATYANGASVYNLTTTANATVDLYAVLAANVIFNANGGTGSKSPVEVCRGKTYTLPSCPFSRTGYKFAGWKIISCCTAWDNPYAVGTKITVNEHTTLMATWTPDIKNYTVRFHYNDPDIERTSKSEAMAEEIYNQTFTVGQSQCLAWKDSQIGWSNPAGYYFAGWARTATATTAAFSNGQRVLNLATSGTFHLYAVWKVPSGTYLVKFYSNYPDEFLKTGSIPKPDYRQSFKVGATQSIAWKDSQMKISTPTGYRFLGWSKSSSATSAAYGNGEKVKNIGSSGNAVKLYAVWQKVTAAKTYTVRYNKNDGSGATATHTFTVGVAQRLKWLDSQLKWTRSGYTFVGWSANGGAFYTNGQSVKDLTTAGNTINLYAIWMASSKSAVKGDIAAPATPSETSDESFAPGYYHGTFADGSGTFDLLVDEFDEDGVATAYFAAATENGTWSEECEAYRGDDGLVLVCDKWTTNLSYDNGDFIAK